MSNKNFSNSIIVGGPIAAGKSILVDSIANSLGFNKITELDENDELSNIILRKLYQQERLHPATIQTFFLASRCKTYSDNANGLIPTVFDRGILEDKLFCIHVMKDEKKYLDAFLKLWKKQTKDLFEKNGYPRLYVFLTVNWENFKKRVYKRARMSEVVNFSKNEKYFKALLEDYEIEFEVILNNWGINYLKIDTNELTPIEVLNISKNKIQKLF